jgi:hypothetical protein
VNEYDKDCTFGANAGGTFITQPNMTYVSGNILTGFSANAGPQKFINSISDYQNTKIARYVELRQSNVISPSSIIADLHSWCSRIGLDNYEKEYNKWNESPCNKSLEINENWELYQPQDNVEYGNIALYSDSTTYHAGDKCRMEGYLCFKVKANVSNVTGTIPVTNRTHKDNIYRFANWVNERIRLLDEYCNYNQN